MAGDSKSSTIRLCSPPFSPDIPAPGTEIRSSSNVAGQDSLLVLLPSTAVPIPLLHGERHTSLSALGPINFG